MHPQMIGACGVASGSARNSGGRIAIGRTAVSGKLQEFHKLRLEVLVKTSFGTFTLDSEAKQLLSGGRAVHVSPKAFALLETLLNSRPRVLSKTHLQEQLWPHTFVAEANLSNLIAEVRRAIGDCAHRPRF